MVLPQEEDWPTALSSFLAAQRWDEAVALLLNPAYLEARVEAGFAFELADDFLDTLAVLPPHHAGRTLLQLLSEALLHNLHFIVRHPTTLFQCLWNSGWWYDAPQAAAFYEAPAGSETVDYRPWQRLGPKLSVWLEAWRAAKEEATPGFPWVRSLRPPTTPLGGAQRAVLPIDTQHWRIRSLRFAADGCIVAWLHPIGADGEGEMTARVWESRTGRAVTEFLESEYPFREQAASEDGRWRVVAGSWGEPVRLVGATSELERASFAIPDYANMACAALSADGRLVAAGGYGEESEGHLFLWEAASGQHVPSPEVTDTVWAVAFSPDGRQIATGHSGGAIRVWDVLTARQVVILTGHTGFLTALAFASDGRWLASASYDGTIRVWDLEPVLPVLHPHSHPDGIVDAVFSTDGQRLVSLSANGAAWLWNGVTGAPVARLHHSDSVVLIGGCGHGALFADETRVVSVAGDAGGVWDARNGERLENGPQEHEFYSISSVVFAPGGKRFAVVRCRSDLLLYQIGDAAAATNFAGHEGDITGFSFSPDGQRLVSGSEDGTVRVWDVERGRELVCFRGHEGIVTCVAFSPDGRQVASGGVDRTVRVWDVKLGEQAACMPIADPGVWSCVYSSSEQPDQVTEGVADLAFAIDGRRILTLSSDSRLRSTLEQRIRIWDPFSGQCLGTITGEGDLPAIALGKPWRALARGDEVVVESAATGEAVGWLPCPLFYRGRKLTTAPSGRVWAVAIGAHLFHFALEGGLSETAPRSA